MAATATTNHLFAQQNARTAQKVETRSNLKNEVVSVVKINSTETGCTILVGNEIKSPKDAASGLPTGKRMHKPFTITKEIGIIAKDNSVVEATHPRDATSGLPTGKRMVGGPIGGIIVKGGRNPGGSQFDKIVVEDGQFTLPSDCPDGEYTMSLSWGWGASNSSGAKKCEKSFKLTMENGVCKGITQSGIK